MRILHFPDILSTHKIFSFIRIPNLLPFCESIGFNPTIVRCFSALFSTPAFSPISSPSVAGGALVTVLFFPNFATPPIDNGNKPFCDCPFFTEEMPIGGLVARATLDE